MSGNKLGDKNSEKVWPLGKYTPFQIPSPSLLVEDFIKQSKFQQDLLNAPPPKPHRFPIKKFLYPYLIYVVVALIIASIFGNYFKLTQESFTKIQAIFRPKSNSLPRPLQSNLQMILGNGMTSADAIKTDKSVTHKSIDFLASGAVQSSESECSGYAESVQGVVKAITPDRDNPDFVYVGLGSEKDTKIYYYAAIPNRPAFSNLVKNTSECALEDAPYINFSDNLNKGIIPAFKSTNHDTTAAEYLKKAVAETNPLHVHLYFVGDDSKIMLEKSGLPVVAYLSIGQ